MTIRPANTNDASQIAGIYNHYIATSHATFEIDPIDPDEMLRRIDEIQVGGYPFLIYEANSEIAGYACGHEFRSRPAYRHSVEVSVYVKPGHERKGVGTLLYKRLFAEIRAGDFHAIIAGISLPNEASIRLHEKFGFEKVAHFHEVGRKFGRWIDAGYWELILST
jgi:L-amino acid N-acyltransferase YncA